MDIYIYMYIHVDKYTDSPMDQRARSWAGSMGQAHGPSPWAQRWRRGPCPWALGPGGPLPFGPGGPRGQPPSLGPCPQDWVISWTKIKIE